MFTISFDLSQFERAAVRMSGTIDQVPFAIANAMNAAAFETRKVLTGSTWPQHIGVRNKSFISASLRVNKANKRALRISIYDRLRHADLSRLETGGEKQGRGGSLAIPAKAVADRRTGKGVPRGLRPLNATNTFKVPGTKGGSVIYQRGGKGRAERLKLLYVLKPSAQIRPEVPFHEDFRRAFTSSLARAFPRELAKAMATRRR